MKKKGEFKKPKKRTGRQKPPWQDAFEKEILRLIEVEEAKESKHIKRKK